MDKLITNDVCLNILQQCDPNNQNILNNNITIEKIHVKKFSEEQQGFMGEHFHLEISTSENRTYTFFIKSKPIILPSFEQYVNEIGIFKKEVQLFETLLEILRKFSTIQWCPKVYYTIGNDAMIMDNLIRKGYRTLNHREYFSYNHLKVFLKTLAAFHGTSIIYEQLTRKNTNLKNFKLSDKYAHLMEESAYHSSETHVRRKWLVSNTEAFLTCAKQLKNFKPEYEQRIRDILMDFPDRMKRTTNYLQVMNHGDLWCNNIMFSGDTDNDNDELKCLLVDFQFSRYTSPLQDIMLGLYTTTNREFRQKYFEHLMNIYYEALTNELKMYSLNINEIYQKTDYIQSYKEYQIFGILEGALFTMLVFYRPEDIDYMYASTDNFWKFNLGNKNDFVLNIFQNDEHLRERVRDIFEDIVQYVL